MISGAPRDGALLSGEKCGLLQRSLPAQHFRNASNLEVTYGCSKYPGWSADNNRRGVAHLGGDELAS
jgi:hypothetical protein